MEDESTIVSLYCTCDLTLARTSYPLWTEHAARKRIRLELRPRYPVLQAWGRGRVRVRERKQSVEIQLLPKAIYDPTLLS